MMVETVFESSQDFGMSNGSLPQWKRELLQRRAARSRPPAAPAPPPPPPPPPPGAADDDEELRYGPGIVKRLKSRYLSLALRDAPRRRPSVLRRATSLEHLLDERPPIAPRTTGARAPRPASMAVPAASAAAATRRESVKRARSVDALSRLDSREELAPPSPSPPPPPLAPRPPVARTARLPRRPAPLLRDTERPPPDVVRSTLRKFESTPLRRTAPAARLSAVLRGLEGPRRSVTPETPEPARSPSPPAAAERHPATPPPLPASPPPPSPSTLTPPPPSLLAPTPAPPLPTSPSPIEVNPPFFPAIPVPAPTVLPPEPNPTPINKVTPDPAPAPTVPSSASPPSVDEPECAVAMAEARPVTRAVLEGIARAGCTMRYAFEAPRGGSHLPLLAATNSVLVARGGRRVGIIRPMPASPRARADSLPTEEREKADVRPASPPEEPAPVRREPPAALVEPMPRAPESPEPAVPLVNGHSTPEPRVLSRIGAAGIERAWSGSNVKKIEVVRSSPPREAPAPEQKAPWLRGGAGRARAPPPAATSVVFNFSNRKEVPDYIENDGIILRASRRDRIKAGETGVVVLRPEALSRSSDSESEGEGEGGPPSPCGVRFVNDNVLINGRSSMPGRRDRDRIAKLKLQFDDSLTRTFEYPSETSLCEEPPAPAAPPAPPVPPAPAAEPAHAQLADNTHIASAALSRYTPSKTPPQPFQLGVTRHKPAPAPHTQVAETENGVDSADAEEGGDARPCGADAARSWSDARTLATDLLF